MSQMEIGEESKVSPDIESKEKLDSKTMGDNPALNCKLNPKN